MNPGRYPFLWAALFCGCGIAFGRCAAVPVRLGFYIFCLLCCLLVFRRGFLLRCGAFFLFPGDLRWACVRIVSAGDIARTANLIQDRSFALTGKVISETAGERKGFLLSSD
jgi:hypothetical protein